MTSFYIKSLGCKTNQLEGQIIRECLIKNGFIETKNKNEAQIYIINSCTVTNHADNQALYLIKQIKKQNQNIKVVLAGCMAQTADLSSTGADLILGNKEKLEIEKYINKLFESDSKQNFVQNIFEQKTFFNKFLINSNSTRPSVKIQDGCNRRCSYCAIPLARGNSRSNNIKDIIEQINIHIKNNRKEIVLTGIHIGEWGLEFNNKLINLLYEIEKTDILRYRLGSLYVNEIDDELFEFLANSKKFCQHFHLSLQSLCNKTLKNMNRKYTKEEALNTISKIHKNFDLPYIGCDIITGFPYENDEDFMETKQALIDAKVTYIHSFPYSKRKNTKAYYMEEQVLEHIKKERTKALIEVSDCLHKEFLNKNKNKIRTVLYEKKGKTGCIQESRKIILKFTKNLKQIFKIHLKKLTCQILVNFFNFYLKNLK